MTSIEHIKDLQYGVILKELQNGWIDYIEQRNQSLWLDNIDIYYDECNWYNECWIDWINLNYSQNKEHYMSRVENEIWEDILGIHVMKIKVVVYILLILFGFYMTNHTIFYHRN